MSDVISIAFVIACFAIAGVLAIILWFRRNEDWRK